MTVIDNSFAAAASGYLFRKKIEKLQFKQLKK